MRAKILLLALTLAVPTLGAAAPASNGPPANPTRSRLADEPGAVALAESESNVDRMAAAPDAAPPKPPVPKCITVSSYVVNSAPGFDHVVKLESQCDKDAVCSVRTDVAPERLTVDLPAGQTREVVTFRGAPGYAFRAQVECELDD